MECAVPIPAGREDCLESEGRERHYEEAHIRLYLVILGWVRMAADNPRVLFVVVNPRTRCYGWTVKVELNSHSAMIIALPCCTRGRLHANKVIDTLIPDALITLRTGSSSYRRVTLRISRFAI